MEHNFYRRYTGSYTVIYLVLSVLYMATAYVPLFEKPPASFNFLIAMLAVYYPAYIFAKDHGRVPDKSERKRFAISAFLSITLFSVIAMTLLWTLAIPAADRAQILRELGGTPVWVFTFAVVLLTALYYLGLKSAFGVIAKWQLKMLESGKEKGR